MTQPPVRYNWVKHWLICVWSRQRLPRCETVFLAPFWPIRGSLLWLVEEGEGFFLRRFIFSNSCHSASLSFQTYQQRLLLVLVYIWSFYLCWSTETTQSGLSVRIYEMGQATLSSVTHCPLSRSEADQNAACVCAVDPTVTKLCPYKQNTNLPISHTLVFSVFPF